MTGRNVIYLAQSRRPIPALPLVMSAKMTRHRDGRATDEHADIEFLRIRPSILDRDEHTCRFCGFSAPHYMEVHHLDDDHTNNDPSNLVTASPFCHMSQHIGRAGVTGEAVLISWPSATDPAKPAMSQADFNLLCYVLYTSRGDDKHPLSRTAAGLLKELDSLQRRAHTDFKTSRPDILASMLREMHASTPIIYERRQEIFDRHAILLMPTGKRSGDGGADLFAKMKRAWRGTAFLGLPLESWETLLAAMPALSLESPAGLDGSSPVDSDHVGGAERGPPEPEEPPEPEDPEERAA